MIPTRNLHSRILPTIAGLALASTCAHAAIIITPTGASSTTTIGVPRDINAAISGLGLSATPSDLLSKTHDGGNVNSHWLSGQVVNTTTGISASEILTFNLGGSFDLDTIYIWTYNRPERNRGIKTFDISFSTDNGANYSTPVTASSLGMSDFLIGTNDGNDISTVQTRSITEQAGVTHVRFTNITNFGSQDRLAIAEIRFGGVIPEPSTALLGGLGLLALLRRRR